MNFNPYLFFGGNCREAFELYHEVFGGELQIMTMADAPDEAPPGKEDFVIHAALQFEGTLLMASDDPMTDDFGPVQGMMVSYSAESVDDAHRVFDALASGGTVTQPLEATFFSPAFGMCTDKFGTPWMVGAEPVEET